MTKGTSFCSVLCDCVQFVCNFLRHAESLHCGPFVVLSCPEFECPSYMN